MIEWSDDAIAAALRVWLRLSEVGEFRDVRWRETMRQALEAAANAQLMFDKDQETKARKR
jgi:hypothetical protein